jgi:Protein of unknown function (DUF2939)
VNQYRFRAGPERPTQSSEGVVRKTMAAVLVFGLVWIGYIAWPLYDLLVLLHAIETRDVDTVTRHVYFDAVRISLTNQVVAAYVRRTGVQIGPLRRNIAAAAIADPVVKRLVSPEALTELLAVGWPITVLPVPPPGTVGITTSSMGTIWQIFGSSEYGFGRFEVSGPPELPPQQRFLLSFRLLQWRWRLIGVTLPENIQNLFADELVKAMRGPAQRP